MGKHGLIPNVVPVLLSQTGLSATSTSWIHPVKLDGFLGSDFDTRVINLCSSTFTSVVLLKSLLCRSQLVEDVFGSLPLVIERLQVLLHCLQVTLQLVMDRVSYVLTAGATITHGKLLVEGTKRLLVRFKLLFGLGQRHFCLCDRVVCLVDLGLQLPLEVRGLLHPPRQLPLRLIAGPSALPLRMDHDGIALVAEPHSILFTPHRLGDEFFCGDLARLFV
mmetsp:Transcript_44197/g.127881  ORF Transcript_44197/g.127881 Transcript_44197/m.127881 type:complete len:220 (-) Transcript_44197:964-1623(-)